MTQNILEAPLRFPDRKKFKLKYSDDFESVVTALLERDVSKRLGAKDGAKEVLAHPFFAGVNVQDYLDKKVTPTFKPAFDEMDLSKFFNIEMQKEAMDFTEIPKQ